MLLRIVSRRMVEKAAGIGSGAVERATGYPWDHWFAHLDERQATDLDHREIVSLLATAGVEQPWWQQQIAVGYEQERSMRAVGETAEAGFQVGCQRTIPLPQRALWNLLLSADGIATWLGPGLDIECVPGEMYETADMIQGEIRTRTEETRLRLTWQPPGWIRSSTLQLTLSCPRNSADTTTLRIHHEHLADAPTREAMRVRWQAVLDDLERMATTTNGKNSVRER